MLWIENFRRVFTMIEKKANWNAIGAVAAILSLIAGLAYNYTDLFFSTGDFSPADVETHGDQSPAVIGNSGNVSISN